MVCLPEAHQTNVDVVVDRSMLAKWGYMEYGSLQDACRVFGYRKGDACCSHMQEGTAYSPASHGMFQVTDEYDRNRGTQIGRYQQGVELGDRTSGR